MEPHQTSPLEKNRLSKVRPLLFLFIFGSLLFLANSFFSIKNIECYSQNSQCTTQTLEKISKLKNQSLFFSDLDQISGQFSEVKIQKKLPNTLVVTLKEENRDYFNLVGSEIKKSDYENHDPQVTELANNLTNELKKAQINFNKIEFINQVLIVYFENRGSEYRALIDKQDIVTGIYRLKTTLDHIDIKGQVDASIKEIDTRFKLPVLKTQFTNI
ncbi:FtsQ-type POTRA domain-containing protein [Patescibacteria group bacterium]|nr:FtsQ-type POTRA domain-containing protein [Patescibacteria group bacterium]